MHGEDPIDYISSISTYY